MNISRDELQERIEKAVLEALDTTMNELVHGEAEPEVRKIGGNFIRPTPAGWRDEDLPTLLPAIRNHSRILHERFFQ